MAKIILWFIATFGCIKLITDQFNHNESDYFTRIVMISCLGILAICDSIEKGK